MNPQFASAAIPEPARPQETDPVDLIRLQLSDVHSSYEGTVAEQDPAATRRSMLSLQSHFQRLQILQQESKRSAKDIINDLCSELDQPQSEESDPVLVKERSFEKVLVRQASEMPPTLLHLRQLSRRKSFVSREDFRFSKESLMDGICLDQLLPEQVETPTARVTRRTSMGPLEMQIVKHDIKQPSHLTRESSDLERKQADESAVMIAEPGHGMFTLIDHQEVSPAPVSRFAPLSRGAQPAPNRVSLPFHKASSMGDKSEQDDQSPLVRPNGYNSKKFENFGQAAFKLPKADNMHVSLNQLLAAHGGRTLKVKNLFGDSSSQGTDSVRPPSRAMSVCLPLTQKQKGVLGAVPTSGEQSSSQSSFMQMTGTPKPFEEVGLALAIKPLKEKWAAGEPISLTPMGQVLRSPLVATGHVS